VKLDSVGYSPVRMQEYSSGYIPYQSRRTFERWL